MEKSVGLTIAAGVSLLIPAFLGAGGPTILQPLPVLILLPLLFLSRAALGVPTVLFFLWNPGLFWGNAKVPKRSYVLLAITTVLSVAYFVASWKLGLEFQGARYTYAVCIINIAWIALLWILFMRVWKREPSFGMSLFLHWMLFTWLAWYAFPFFGEFI